MTEQISAQLAPASRTGIREAGRPAVPRRVAFWLLALVLATVMLGTTLPTPLYVVYQAQWHFSAAMVTVTFAVYAAAVMVTLLLAGRSSDQAGRKPVLGVALGASALSTLMFILAPDVGALIAARIVSGLSAGLVTGTATAALTELVPASASPGRGGVSSSPPARPPSPPSPCSGCFSRWRPPSSGTCWMRAATPFRASSCSC